MIKKGLLTVLLALFLTAPVRAGEVGAAGTAGLSVQGGPFFLRLDNRLIVLFGDVTVNGDIDGDALLFFSSLTVVGGSLSGVAYCLSSEIRVPERYELRAAPLLGTGAFGYYETYGGFSGYGNALPGFVIRVVAALARAACVLVLLSVRRAFFEQGFCAIRDGTASVLKAGATFYFFCAALIIIFALSVFMFPVSLFIIAFAAAVSVVGETSVCMYAGYKAAGALRVAFADETYGFAALGLIIIETLCLAPFLDNLMTFLIVPVVSCGALCMILLNGFYYKKFYSV